MKRTAAPPVIKALRAFTRSDPTVNDRETLEALEKELFNTSDRVTAVMLGALVETALEKLLASRLHHRRDRTFSEKINIAHEEKIIGPITRSDLYFIRELRNEFAHSRRPFDFQTPQVVAVCNELKVPKLGSLHESALSVRDLGRSMNGLRAGMFAPPLMAAVRESRL